MRALNAQMHSERITGGLSADQETELQCLVHQLPLSDEAPSTSTSVLVTPPSPNSSILLTLYFPYETNEDGTFVESANMIDEAILHDEYSDKMLVVNMSQITDDVQLETVSLLNLFGVLAIEMVKNVQLIPTPGLLNDVVHDDDVFEGIISPIMVESEHVDPPFSFDVLLRFVSCSDDVLALSSYIDMSLF